MQRSLFALPLLLFILLPAAHSEQSSLSGCEAPATLRKTIKDEFHSPTIDYKPYVDQLERTRQKLSVLITRYPREIQPYEMWLIDAREDQLADPDLLAGIQKDYRTRATAHPDDPLALYIAADALYQTDTPESIRMLERAQTLAPAFLWPSLRLAQIYNDGKFADKAKFNDQLTKFWTACPASQDQQARWMLVKNLKLQAKVAQALRPMLAKSTDPDRLQDYEFLWASNSAPPRQPNFPPCASRSLRTLSAWSTSTIRIRMPIGPLCCFMATSRQAQLPRPSAQEKMRF